MIAKRAEKIETDIKEAENRRIESENLKKIYASKLQEIEKENKEVKILAIKEAQALKEQLLLSAEKEAERINLQTKDFFLAQEIAFQGKIKNELIKLIETIPVKMLQEVVDLELQEKFFLKAIKYLEIISEEDKIKMRSSIKKGSKIFIISPLPLSQSSKKNLEEKLTNILNIKPFYFYQIDQSLVAGIRIALEEVVIDTSPKKQLNNLAQIYLEKVMNYEKR